MTAQKIDFNGLLKDLFQENVPIEENVQECPHTKSNVSKLDTSTADSKRGVTLDTPPLQACNLYVFMRKIVMERFGMGYDYAINDRNGLPLKSWFTVSEAIEAAKSQGYKLTVTEARNYLDRLLARRYIETDNYRYRRCAFWDKGMEEYLTRGH